MLTRLLLLAASLAPLALWSAAGGPASASDRPALATRGFNFTTWSPDAYAGAGAEESLRRVAATGANAVALIPTWYQASRTATQIAPDPDRSPTDASLVTVAARARALGLKVFLRPVVDTENGAPRSALAPSSASAWFRSYRGFMDHYAELAQRLRAEMLSVGLEYRSLDGPRWTAQWRLIIRAVRERFHGRLTYGASNGDAWRRIGFWRSLDTIGIDAYFRLSTAAVPGPRVLVKRWSVYLQPMARLARRYRKPIVFTEIGYPSARRALSAPWASGGRYSGGAQRAAFRAAFRALAARRWFKGFYIWEWSADPEAGGPGETGHTPQGKPAERTISGWYRGGRSR
jgi:hypothetical protein